MRFSVVRDEQVSMLYNDDDDDDDVTASPDLCVFSEGERITACLNHVVKITCGKTTRTRLSVLVHFCLVGIFSW